jgi:hypothetical protein
MKIIKENHGHTITDTGLGLGILIMKTSLVKEILILMLLNSCGSYNNRGASYSLQELYSKLETELETKFTYFITYAEQPGPSKRSIGYCYYGSNILLKETLKNGAAWRLESVLLHELGHCEYGLDHEDTGIMRSTLDNELGSSCIYGDTCDYITASEYSKDREIFIARIKEIIKARFN